MKDCHEIERIIHNNSSSANSFFCATLTDNSIIIFCIPNDCDLYTRFLVSCCAMTIESLEDYCDGFGEDFLILHPEDIIKITPIDYNQIQRFLETPESGFILDEDEFDDIEDDILEFLRLGGTICIKGDPFDTFGEHRNINSDDAPVAKGTLAKQDTPVQQTVTSITIVGRKRKLFS